jgi:hypothetical protein
MPKAGRFNLSPSRRGVSTYLQTFLLISVALGASFTIYRTVQTYSGQISAPSVSISYPSIKQGAGVALESITISNLGTGPTGDITVMNPEAPASALYCYALWDPTSQSTVSTTCPNLKQDPTSVQLAWSLSPGASGVFELTVKGSGAFAIGQSYPVTVAASSAAQDTVDIVAVPA